MLTTVESTTPTVLAIKLGTYEEVYHLVETTAPAAYDYCYTIPLYGQGEDVTSRFVLIPDARVQFQMGRYGSGLHATARSDVFDQAEVAQMLRARLFHFPETK